MTKLSREASGLGEGDAANENEPADDDQLTLDELADKADKDELEDDDEEAPAE